ncbi:MAG: Efflux ABC transporter, permease protein [Candidatus Beckwithbacteria bacterium GW2011_GWA2_43_10]|uniref:Cell division protein FtsX n=1 Tax=Candidatus Beckwithbacteria bacterium GW2011_GWA2_43_10 TaxID=1618369 RepID=A0A0G1BZL3_9BACT|nr:MAG: Efflux ABC transporter, permease protein [Candidatus Beckwithbacteria bacterium GW2011_GWA2_43_10]
MNIFQKTLTQIRRSPFQNLTAIMTTTLTLLVVSVFSLLSIGSIKILKYFESAPQVIAFFKPGEDLNAIQIANIRAQLDKTGKVNEFRYVSTREAEAIYKEKNKDNPLLLELVDYNILPASIEISAKDLKDLKELKNVLQVQEGVDEVVYYEDIVTNLSKWILSVKKLGVGMIAYLTLESVLVILVIIGMQIASRKEEIEILKLIGATNWFIRKPFILTAIVYGLTGSLLAWGLSYLLLLYSTPFLADWLGDIPLLPFSFMVMGLLLAGELVLGVMIGIIGGLLATHRFLKE